LNEKVYRICECGAQLASRWNSISNSRMACTTYIKVQMVRTLANKNRRASRFPRCSGYGKRECAVPLGLGASPSRGSLRGKAKDRANNWTFFEKSWKKSEKIGKNWKQLENIPKRSAHLFETCF